MSNTAEKLRVTTTDIPGLFDVVLVNAVGDVLQELRDLTAGQVEHLARQHGVGITTDPPEVGPHV
jgi:hypothetical protein